MAGADGAVGRLRSRLVFPGHATRIISSKAIKASGQWVGSANYLYRSGVFELLSAVTEPSLT